MYERSASVLERYFEKLFGFTKDNNLKTNYANYANAIDRVKEYQETVDEEERVIEKFDEAAGEIESIQGKQAKLFESNMELENERNKIFNDLGENPNTLDSRLQKIEKTLELNNEELKELRERYVKALVIFTDKQKERNKYARIRRNAEAGHIQDVEYINKAFEKIDANDVKKMKQFLNSDNTDNEQELINIMVRNGKNEKIPFTYEVIKKAIQLRIQIARTEAEIYVSIYEKTKKLLMELNEDSVKLAKSEKTLRDADIRLAFINAEKEYIVCFLDNERMTSISGKKAHDNLMEEACKNFDLDVEQINNLYELILKEISGKATKKLYKELYNKTYLKNIEQKQRNFEQEVTNIRLDMGTVINFNYWRIEGIRNIYTTFQNEIEEKVGRDLSEYRIDEEEKEESKIQIDETAKKRGRKAKSTTAKKVTNKIESETFEDGYDDFDDETENDLFNEEYEDDEEDDDIEEYDEYDEYDDEFDTDEDDDDEFNMKAKDFEEDDEEEDEEYEDDDDDGLLNYDRDEKQDDDTNEKMEDEDSEDDEDEIDLIIQNSRRKGSHMQEKKSGRRQAKRLENKKPGKGLFNKFFGDND